MAFPAMFGPGLHRQGSRGTIRAMRNAPQKPDTSPRRVRAMFDSIAPSYDLLNRVLSLRRDVAWRRKLANNLPGASEPAVLDIATGTADVLIALDRTMDGRMRGLGADVSAGMLTVGHKKLQHRGLTPRCAVVQADGLHLPVPANSFDAATIAFGIRNLPDVRAGLREMHRVLRPGGRALVLEFSLPGNALLRAAYLLYFRHLLPRIGGWVARDLPAYRYLNQTVESFPYGEAFCALMREAGFARVRAHPLSFGIASLYLGDKPEE